MIFFLDYLKNNFSKVTYVRNITDIDDKIIKSSQDQKISAKELTEKVTSSFFEDCKFLNCENPSHQPKATEHIDLMIEMINQLIKKDFAYENNKHVYFEVKKFSDYGKLSNKKLEDLIAGSRIEISDNKKIQRILFYGNHQIQMNLHGILLGVKEDLGGI